MVNQSPDSVDTLKHTIAALYQKMILQNQRIERLERNIRHTASLDELGKVMEKFDTRIVEQEIKTTDIEKKIETLNTDLTDMNHMITANNSSIGM